MTLVQKNPEEDNNLTPSGNVNISGVEYTQDDSRNDTTTSTILKASVTEIVSGPLPHPRLLKEYDNVIANGAERIMAMAEKEQDNRIKGDIETREVNSRIAFEELQIKRAGQGIALMIILLIFGLVVLFTFTGHEAVAIGLLAIGIAGIISAFMGLGNNKKSKS